MLSPTNLKCFWKNMFLYFWYFVLLVSRRVIRKKKLEVTVSFWCRPSLWNLEQNSPSKKIFYYFHKSNWNSIQLVFNPEHFYGLMSNNLVPINIMGKQGWFKYFLCDFREWDTLSACFWKWLMDWCSATFDDMLKQFPYGQCRLF